MPLPKCHVGDVGALFDLTLLTADGSGPVDLTNATRTDFVFRTPRSKIMRVSAQIIGAPTAGRLRYETVAGDLVEFGEWRFQPDIVLGDGRAFHGLEHCFSVGKLLEPFSRVAKAAPAIIPIRAGQAERA